MVVSSSFFHSFHFTLNIFLTPPLIGFPFCSFCFLFLHCLSSPPSPFSLPAQWPLLPLFPPLSSSLLSFPRSCPILSFSFNSTVLNSSLLHSCEHKMIKVPILAMTAQFYPGAHTHSLSHTHTLSFQRVHSYRWQALCFCFNKLDKLRFNSSTMIILINVDLTLTFYNLKLFDSCGQNTYFTKWTQSRSLSAVAEDTNEQSCSCNRFHKD